MWSKGGNEGEGEGEKKNLGILIQVCEKSCDVIITHVVMNGKIPIVISPDL